jgi:hypothetical protein
VNVARRNGSSERQSGLSSTTAALLRSW